MHNSLMLLTPMLIQHLQLVTDDGAQPAGAADATGMRLTVRYDMGGIQLRGTYQMLELDSENTIDHAASDHYDGKTVERDTMALNIVIPTATGRVMCCIRFF